MQLMSAAMSKIQRTLFQAWGSTKQAGPSRTEEETELLGDDDDEDALLVRAMELSLCEDGVHVGFDRDAGREWIYPTNLPVRDYQFTIVHKSLFHNTLVILPTGLGKTFIAAVVMYNFFRWYPMGKVIFMAPTRPLVAQQIEACFKIMGIPQNDTVELTGTTSPAERRKAWQERRVFFLTPQVLANDLSRGSCQPESIKCVVIDEAHKALGNHAYCQVVKEILNYTSQFRVLALSASPGSDMKAVRQVLTNLLISQVELRTEDCPDIQPYTHQRLLQKMVVPMGDQLTSFKSRFLQVIQVYLNRLNARGALGNSIKPESLSKFRILKLREAFNQSVPANLTKQAYGLVQGDFSILISLYHAFELLELHGLRPFRNFLQGILTGEKGQPRAQAELARNTDFTNLMTDLTTQLDPSQNSPTAGHPKLLKLQEIVLEHFSQHPTGSRIMIFSQYRDSCEEIATLLRPHAPLVKVMAFIGQNSTTSRGLTQKQQLRVVREFREGGFNTLVSTCVGEEGLDIGEVDLIICFDAPKSPIRLVQRMGRTGRCREGRIVMLVTQGKEEQMYNQSQYSKRSIHKAITEGSVFQNLYSRNPRMVPPGLEPACHKMFMAVKQFQPPRSRLTSAEKRKSKVFLDTTESNYFSSFFKEGLSQLPGREVATTHDGEGVQLDQGSISQWLPHQSVLQPTATIGHSTRSRALVRAMEFADFLAASDSTGDAYGAEMKAFLVTDDVNLISVATIDSFLVPSPKPKESPADIHQQKEEVEGISEADSIPHEIADAGESSNLEVPRQKDISTNQQGDQSSARLNFRKIDIPAVIFPPDKLQLSPVSIKEVVRPVDSMMEDLQGASNFDVSFHLDFEMSLGPEDIVGPDSLLSQSACSNLIPPSFSEHDNLSYEKPGEGRIVSLPVGSPTRKTADSHGLQKQQNLIGKQSFDMIPPSLPRDEDWIASLPQASSTHGTSGSHALQEQRNPKDYDAPTKPTFDFKVTDMLDLQGLDEEANFSFAAELKTANCEKVEEAAKLEESKISDNQDDSLFARNNSELFKTPARKTSLGKLDLAKLSPIAKLYPGLTNSPATTLQFASTPKVPRKASAKLSTPTIQSTFLSPLVEKEENDKVVHFELDFEFEDDIIPPSPEVLDRHQPLPKGSTTKPTFSKSLSFPPPAQRSTPSKHNSKLESPPCSPKGNLSSTPYSEIPTSPSYSPQEEPPVSPISMSPSYSPKDDPVTPPKSTVSKCISDSPEESFIRRPKKRIIQFLSSPSPPKDTNPDRSSQAAAAITLDDDDDFVSSYKAPASKKRELSSSTKASRNKRVKLADPADFIEHEAEISQLGCAQSSDESEDSSLNEYDSSFVNDESVDVQMSMYLQSVKNMDTNRAKYKLQYRPKVRENVFSQAVEPDQYQNDSFCVEEASDDYCSESSSPVKKPRRFRRILEAELEEEEEEDVNVVDELQNESLHREHLAESSSILNNANPKLPANSEPVEKEVLLRSMEQAALSTPINFDLINTQDFDSIFSEEGSAEQHSSPKKSPETLEWLSSKPKASVASTPAVHNTADNLSSSPWPLAQRLNNKISNHSIVQAKFNDTPSSPLPPAQLFCKKVARPPVVQSAPNNYSSPPLPLAQRINNEISLPSTSHPMLGNATPPISQMQPASCERPCLVLVDNRELCGGQGVVSALRARHHLPVVAAQLGNADYQVGSRLAVVRLAWPGDLATSRSRLADRLLALASCYEERVVLLQREKLRTGRSQARSKLLDSTLVSLLRAGVRLIHTESPEETAAFLAGYAARENNLGFNVAPTPQQVAALPQSAVDFFTAMPHVNYGTALNLAHGFQSLHNFLASYSRESLKQLGKMGTPRAYSLYKFLQCSAVIL